MSMRTCAQLFAERGDLWNARNDQHNAGQTVRIVRAPNGDLVDVEVEWLVEGYDHNPPRYQRPPEPRAARPNVDRSYRIGVQVPGIKPHRPPEYRSMVRNADTGRHPEAKDVVLSDEQQQLRKKQRAAVKARLTRAANKIKAKEESRKATFAAMIVKLSQGAK